MYALASIDAASHRLASIRHPREMADGRNCTDLVVTERHQRQRLEPVDRALIRLSGVLITVTEAQVQTGAGDILYCLKRLEAVGVTQEPRLAQLVDRLCSDIN